MGVTNLIMEKQFSITNFQLHIYYLFIRQKSDKFYYLLFKKTKTIGER